MHVLRRTLLFLVCALLPSLAPGANWVREIEITMDPEEFGQHVFSFRFTPDRTVTYAAMEFEFFYRQKFPWEDVHGRKYTKTHEPVTFIYRRPKVELVNDLDGYVNFRVPISMARLVRKYGKTTFNRDYPITVNRIRLTAMLNGSNTAWEVTLPPAGKIDARALTKIPDPPPAEDGDGAEKKGN